MKQVGYGAGKCDSVACIGKGSLLILVKLQPILKSLLTSSIAACW